MNEPTKEIQSLSVEERSGPRDIFWNDLIFMSGQRWGLRHVTNLSDAERQMKEGISSGDAVSLAAPQNLIPVEVLEGINVHGISTKTLSFSTIARFVPERYKQQIISKFGNAIRNVIENSLGMDINSIDDSADINKVLDLLTATKSGFLIATFQGAKSPYDVEQYHQLGKCGKQNVKSDNMVALLDLKDSREDIITNLGLTQNDLSTGLSKEKFEKIKNCCTSIIWKKILTVIKEKNK